jgi:hypothetical protein
MKNLMVVALILISAPAFADGFVCQTRNGDLNVKAYNNTDSSKGTRNAAVLLLSDPEAATGNKTIARFTDVTGTLTNAGSSFSANVDLRFKDLSNKTALVAGQVQLQQLDTVKLDVDFSYAQPLPAGENVNGELTLNTRAGDRIVLDMLCQRYLKN